MTRLRFLLPTLAVLAAPAQATPICFCPECLLGKTLSLYAPSESMAPTLPTGSCFKARVFEGDITGLHRGDIVVFDVPRSPPTQFVFRLIGLPGDTIEMRAGVVILNGEALPQEPLEDDVVANVPSEIGMRPRCLAPVDDGADCTRHRLRETLPDGTTYDVLDIMTGPFDTTPVYTVPADHVFVLGDHRDNAADSRLQRDVMGIGFVPVADIRGVVK